MARRKSRSFWWTLVVVWLVLAQVVFPAAARAAVPAAPPAPSTSSQTLTRLPEENREAYLVRMAQAAPERFQAAALRALQDYLNMDRVGPLADVPFEEAIERYLALPPELWVQSDPPSRAQAALAPIDDSPAVAPTAAAGEAASRPAACPPTPIRTIKSIAGPKGLAVNEAANLVYAAQYSDNSLAVIDGATNAVVRVVRQIPSPNQVAHNPVLGRLYVTNRDAGTLTVLNDASYAVVATIPVESLPFGVGVNPNTGRVYVANFNSNSVTVINGYTNKVVARLGLPNLPTLIAVDSVNNLVYTLSNWAGTVYVIDQNDTLREFAQVHDDGLVGLAVNPALNRLYVSSISKKVYAYDTQTRERVAVVNLPGEPHTLALNPNGNGIYAAAKGNELYLIDGNNATYNGATAVGSGEGDGLVVNPRTNRVYVSNYSDNSVAALFDTCAPEPPPVTVTPTHTPTPTRTPTAAHRHADILHDAAHTDIHAYGDRYRQRDTGHAGAEGNSYLRQYRGSCQGRGKQGWMAGSRRPASSSAGSAG